MRAMKMPTTHSMASRTANMRSTRRLMVLRSSRKRVSARLVSSGGNGAEVKVMRLQGYGCWASGVARHFPSVVRWGKEQPKKGVPAIVAGWLGGGGMMELWTALEVE